MVLSDLEHAFEQFCANSHFVASIEGMVHNENRPRPQAEVTNKPHRFRTRDAIDSEFCSWASWTRRDEKIQIAVSSGFPIRDGVARALARHRGQARGGLVFEKFRL